MKLLLAHFTFRQNQGNCDSIPTQIWRNQVIPRVVYFLAHLGTSQGRGCTRFVALLVNSFATDVCPHARPYLLRAPLPP